MILASGSPWHAAPGFNPSTKVFDYEEETGRQQLSQRIGHFKHNQVWVDLIGNENVPGHTTSPPPLPIVIARASVLVELEPRTSENNDKCYDHSTTKANLKYD